MKKCKFCLPLGHQQDLEFYVGKEHFRGFICEAHKGCSFSSIDFVGDNGFCIPIKYCPFCARKLKERIMNREKLLQLKQENRENPILYNLIGVVIGECDRVGKDLSKEQIIAVIKKIYKNNSDVISNCYPQSREDYGRIGNLVEENEFLDTFIPKQLDEGEIRDIINRCIDNGLTTMKELMQFFKDGYSGLYDGKLVSEIAKKYVK